MVTWHEKVYLRVSAFAYYILIFIPLEFCHLTTNWTRINSSFHHWQSILKHNESTKLLYSNKLSLFTPNFYGGGSLVCFYHRTCKHRRYTSKASKLFVVGFNNKIMYKDCCRSELFFEIYLSKKTSLHRNKRLVVKFIIIWRKFRSISGV